MDNFDVNVSDSLDTGLSNGGVFKSNQVTEQGNTPSDGLACLEISSGKAYVRGFRISQQGTTIIDFEKPRDKGPGIKIENIIKIIPTKICKNIIKGKINNFNIIEYLIP